MVVNMRQVLDDLKNKVTNLICLYESFTKYKNIYENIKEDLDTIKAIIDKFSEG